MSKWIVLKGKAHNIENNFNKGEKSTEVYILLKLHREQSNINSKGSEIQANLPQLDLQE